MRVVIDPHAVRAGTEKSIYRSRGENGLFDGVGHTVLILRAFDGDPWARRGESDIPIGVKRQFVHLAGEILEARHKVIGKFTGHILDAFLAATARSAKTIF